MNSDQLLKFVEETLDDIKAIDVTAINVKELTALTDYMVVCTGRSSRHVQAIADNVVKAAKDKKHQPLGVEGKSSEWILVDLNDIIVHIMMPETRAFYNLEKLWDSTELRQFAEE